MSRSDSVILEINIKKLAVILSTLTLLLSSCSNISIGRRIADVEDNTAVIDELLSFKASGVTLPAAYKEDEYKRNLDNILYSLQREKTITLTFVKTDGLENDVLFKIEPVFGTNNNYSLKILHSNDAMKDYLVVQELLNYLHNILSKRVASRFTLFEILINAKENDPTALRALATLRKYSPAGGNLMNLNKAAVDEYAQTATVAWTEVETKLMKLERQKKKENKILAENRKAVMDALDAAPESKQLRTLIANGDRHGAADLISSYLPWEDMRPFEKHFWETQLDIMRNPVPVSKRVMIFRGIQDDIIQTPIVEGKKLELEAAIKEQNIFVMSTLMTKNQGSWNRRLRSLTSMNKKFMGTAGKDNVSEITEAARISTYLNRHAENPMGSPFLSFTPDYSTASTFGKDKISVYLIDPRALTFNYSSVHTQEKEFLLPLATFPDDIAAVHVEGISPPISMRSRDLVIQDMVMEKLMKEMGNAEGLEAYKKIVDNSKSFFNHYTKYNTDKIAEKSALHAEEIAKIPVIEGPKKPMEASCSNILKAFWK